MHPQGAHPGLDNTSSSHPANLHASKDRKAFFSGPTASPAWTPDRLCVASAGCPPWATQDFFRPAAQPPCIQGQETLLLWANSEPVMDTEPKKMTHNGGAWVVQSVRHLPSAQVMISGSWDRAPCRAPCSARSLLLSLPLLLPLLVLFFLLLLFSEVEDFIPSRLPQKNMTERKANI